MPIGLKNVGKLKPNHPLDEKSFIRGMFDTDGCVYRKYGKYVQIQFKSASPSLMEYLKRTWKNLVSTQPQYKKTTRDSKSTFADKMR